jgi:hypothetical protein
MRDGHLLLLLVSSCLCSASALCATAPPLAAGRRRAQACESLKLRESGAGSQGRLLELPRRGTAPRAVCSMSLDGSGAGRPGAGEGGDCGGLHFAEQLTLEARGPAAETAMAVGAGASYLRKVRFESGGLAAAAAVNEEVGSDGEGDEGWMDKWNDFLTATG